jgi:tRNA modification GTPase
MAEERDTIAAPATPPGRGSIGVVRVSGPATRRIAVGLFGDVPHPRHARLRAFADADGQPIDAGLALFFPGPHSFTGEDVLELQGHGGPVVVDLLLARVLELGARLARPGEFTERAFLNDKIDLAQAEAVADLIDAGSAQAARAALRSLAGDFSREVRELEAALTELRVYVEASIDFPDEDVEFLQSPEATLRVADIEARFEAIGAAAAEGRALRDGLCVVIAGKPNAGKSSLLNRLAGYDAAIVTPIPGTTRDVLRERIHVDGLPIHVIDTAGLRDTTDEIEGEGVRRALAEVGRADLVLYVVDASIAPSRAELEAELATLPPGVPCTVVINKLDRLAQPPEPVLLPQLGISALTGLGIDALRDHLKQVAGYHGEGSAFTARRRHLDALARARMHAREALRLLESRSQFELVAEELRQAHRALGEITGEVTSDELLGRIFGSFCIGK